MILTVLFGCIAAGSIIFAIITWNNRKQIDLNVLNENSKILKTNQDITNLNKTLNAQNEQLSIENSNWLYKIANSKSQYDSCNTALQNLINKKVEIATEVNMLTSQEKEQQKRIEELSAAASSSYENQKELSNKALENYFNTLEKAYEEKEAEYDILIKNLEDAYAGTQVKLISELEQVQSDLENMKKSRAAAIEAIQKDKQIKENLSSYCIPVSEVDKADIRRLEDVAITLSKPRILHMLIWSTYFQKPLKTMAASILGSEKVCGIYKITNIETDECYIGQAVSVQDRWSEHCKCGLGIDAPTANKLYKAMREYNLWNFSFQLLEKCEPAKLNEREKYYIEFYNSYNFGYNSTIGNK